MRVHIKTYGCQMNERDSEAALALLVSRGHVAAASEDDADAVILNTCSVRDQAERKALGKLGVLGHLKERKPDLLLGVMGCMAQRLGEELLEKLPHLDFVVGTDQLNHLPETLAEAAAHSRLALIARDPENLEGMDAHRPELARSPISAFISISRGCNRFCSYCIVPYVRGRETSRAPDSIVAEAEALVESGVKEITLLGQNVAAYGFDGVPPPIPDDASPFADLLARLSSLEALRRLRFTSPHPAFFNARLIEAIGALLKVCAAVHLPLQSGSDRVLKAMNRPYDAARYLRIVDGLKAAKPGLLFSTDVIVGFPGETDADFQATREIMETVGFENAFVFKYSPRRGTKAAEMLDDVPKAVKEERNQLLLSDLERRAVKAKESLVGTRVEVMAEGPSKRNASRWSGRDGGNRCVVFDPPPGVAAGEFLTVAVESASASTLYGRVV